MNDLEKAQKLAWYANRMDAQGKYTEANQADKILRRLATQKKTLQK